MTNPRFARAERLLGEKGMARLAASHVTVIGLGAVGSYAVEGLARSGIGHLTLVDFDVVQLSNINRQLYALTSTISQPKVELAGMRAIDINPKCSVSVFNSFVNAENLSHILSKKTDLVVDAIDSMDSKVTLMAWCRGTGIPIVSSMGAARRTDPTRFHTGLLKDTKACPLARQIKKRLRDLNVPLDIACVWSDEPVAHLPETSIGTHEEAELVDNGEGHSRRPMGSLPTTTGVAGLMLAHLAVKTLLGDLWPGKN